VKRTITIFLILASFVNAGLAQTKPPAAAATQKGIEVPFVNKVLPNGFEIIVLPDSSIPLVTVEIAVRNGSFTETP